MYGAKYNDLIGWVANKRNEKGTVLARENLQEEFLTGKLSFLSTTTKRG